MNCEKYTKKNWSRLLKRGTAMALALAMLLPTVAYGASTGVPVTPIPMVKADSEFPNIEIQTNFVRSEYGVLDGTMELALRVGPSETTTVADPSDPDKLVEKPVPVGFRTLSVNLQYDASLYTPISWSWVSEADKDTPADLPLDATKAYTVDIPAKKNDQMPTTGAIAKCGMTTAADGTKSGEGLVYFKAEAYNSDITLTEMTTLAVIRFKIDKSLMSKISILPDGNGGYTVRVEDTSNVPTVVTDVAGLHAVLGRNVPTDPATVGFASDSDIHSTKPPVLMALHYTGANGQQMYYVPGCRVTDKVDVADSTVENVPTKALNIDLPGPKTMNNRVLAVDGDPTVTVVTDKYSYLTNHFDEDDSTGHHHITWPVVSDVSFAYAPVDLSKYITAVFVDWDNNLLGTMILPKGADVREMVNGYVSKNFIYHNADNSENLVPDTVAKVSSLAREDSYRGKYPTTPQLLGANGLTTDPNNTVRLEGEKFPLTNKLDYVFFKRPMEYDEKEGKWEQKTDDNGDVIWDAKYPFAYGWAKCTVDNYKDTWTTLGMGELSNYNGSSVGGYRQLGNGEKASFTYDLDGFDFKMMDFEAGFDLDDNTVFLKAVYEPGTDLLNNTNTYRQLKAPYYNKFNTGNASIGGAYQVEIVYERSNVVTTGKVQGIARMREPVLRQETTTDMKWESLPAKNVTNDDMANADDNSAYTDKDKSTYGKVDISNSEVITAAMAISARQNKLDYYLSDAYGANFVSGGRRSATDSANRLDQGVSTVDNYYYYMENIDESTYYATPKVENRSGTNGFVLYGTLNHIMEMATKRNHGQVLASDFYAALSVDNFKDANLRDANGNAITGRTEETVQNIILAAASAAETAYNNGLGDPQWWNTERNCAELTYHQLQYYILKGTLLPDATEANFQPEITWCNLHKNCVDQRSDTPDNWDKLIAAAREANGGNTAKMDLLNNFATLENLCKLRADGDGKHYADIDALKAAIQAAVAALDGTAGTVIHSWDAVQAQILGETAADAPEKYWWYDGVNQVPFTDWAALRAAADGALDSPSMSIALPDGKPVRNRPAKLNQFEDTFDANGAATVTNTNLSGTDPNWVRATENLVKSVEPDDTTTNKFDDFDAFKTALLDAMKVAYDNGEISPDWYQIQYMILNPTAVFPVKNGEVGAPQDYEGYWWRNGGVNITITDLRSMLQAASLNADVWKEFDFDDMQALSGVSDFRSAFDGSAYTAADFAQFKTRIAGFLTAMSTWQNQNDNDLWDQVQYYLIHGSYDSVGMYAERDYYWWKNGGSAQPVDFTTWQDTDGSGDTEAEQTSRLLRAEALAKALMDAGFRSTYNGNDVAYQECTAGAIENGRLAKSAGATTFDTMAKFTDGDINALKAAIHAVMVAKAGGVTTPTFPVPSATWEEIQFALLHGNTLPTTSQADQDEMAGYWWKINNTKPVELKPEEQEFADLVALIGAVAADPGDPANLAAVQDWLTASKAAYLELTVCGDPATKEDLDSIPWDALDYSAAGCYDSGSFNITWAQINGLFVNLNYVTGDYTLDDPATAESNWNDNIGSPIPGWATSAGYSLRSNAMLSLSNAFIEPSVATMTGEDGTETTTQSLTEVDEETGIITTTTMTTVVTPQEKGTLVVETTTVNTLDPATGETRVEILDTQVVFVPAEETEPAPTESPEPTESAPAESSAPTDPTLSGSGDAAATSPEGGGKDSGEEPEETDLPDPETPLEPELTESPEPTESPEATEDPTLSGSGDAAATSPEGGGKDSGEEPEAPVESTVTPEETPEPGAGGKTESTGEAVEGTHTEVEEPEPSPPAEPAQNAEDPPPDKVTTNVTGRLRLRRVPTRTLKAPPSLRSPNIKSVTTRTVLDRLCVEALILICGRTPK